MDSNSSTLRDQIPFSSSPNSSISSSFNTNNNNNNNNMDENIENNIDNNHSLISPKPKPPMLSLPFSSKEDLINININCNNNHKSPILSLLSPQSSYFASSKRNSNFISKNNTNSIKPIRKLSNGSNHKENKSIITSPRELFLLQQSKLIPIKGPITILSLPNELTGYIIGMLSLNDQINISQTCKQLYLSNLSIQNLIVKANTQLFKDLSTNNNSTVLKYHSLQHLVVELADIFTTTSPYMSNSPLSMTESIKSNSSSISTNDNDIINNNTELMYKVCEALLNQLKKNNISFKNSLQYLECGSSIILENLKQNLPNIKEIRIVEHYTTPITHMIKWDGYLHWLFDPLYAPNNLQHVTLACPLLFALYKFSDYNIPINSSSSSIDNNIIDEKIKIQQNYQLNKSINNNSFINNTLKSLTLCEVRQTVLNDFLLFMSRNATFINLESLTLVGVEQPRFNSCHDKVSIETSFISIRKGAPNLKSITLHGFVLSDDSFNIPNNNDNNYNDYINFKTNNLWRELDIPLLPPWALGLNTIDLKSCELSIPISLNNILSKSLKNEYYELNHNNNNNNHYSIEFKRLINEISDLISSQIISTNDFNTSYIIRWLLLLGCKNILIEDCLFRDSNIINHHILNNNDNNNNNNVNEEEEIDVDIDIDIEESEEIEDHNNMEISNFNYNEADELKRIELQLILLSLPINWNSILRLSTYDNIYGIESLICQRNRLEHDINRIFNVTSIDTSLIKKLNNDMLIENNIIPWELLSSVISISKNIHTVILDSVNVEIPFINELNNSIEFINPIKCINMLLNQNNNIKNFQISTINYTNDKLYNKIISLNDNKYQKYLNKLPKIIDNNDNDDNNANINNKIINKNISVFNLNGSNINTIINYKLNNNKLEMNFSSFILPSLNFNHHKNIVYKNLRKLILHDIIIPKNILTNHNKNENEIIQFNLSFPLLEILDIQFKGLDSHLFIISLVTSILSTTTNLDNLNIISLNNKLIKQIRFDILNKDIINNKKSLSSSSTTFSYNYSKELYKEFWKCIINNSVLITSLRIYGFIIPCELIEEICSKQYGYQIKNNINHNNTIPLKYLILEEPGIEKMNSIIDKSLNKLFKLTNGNIKELKIQSDFWDINNMINNNINLKSIFNKDKNDKNKSMEIVSPFKHSLSESTLNDYSSDNNDDDGDNMDISNSSSTESLGINTNNKSIDIIKSISTNTNNRLNKRACRRINSYDDKNQIINEPDEIISKLIKIIDNGPSYNHKSRENSMIDNNLNDHNNKNSSYDRNNHYNSIIKNLKESTQSSWSEEFDDNENNTINNNNGINDINDSNDLITLTKNILDDDNLLTINNNSSISTYSSSPSSTVTKPMDLISPSGRITQEGVNLATNVLFKHKKTYSLGAGIDKFSSTSTSSSFSSILQPPFLDKSNNNSDSSFNSNLSIDKNKINNHNHNINLHSLMVDRLYNKMDYISGIHSAPLPPSPEQQAPRSAHPPDVVSPGQNLFDQMLIKEDKLNIDNFNISRKLPDNINNNRTETLDNGAKLLHLENIYIDYCKEYELYLNNLVKYNYNSEDNNTKDNKDYNISIIMPKFGRWQRRISSILSTL